MYNGWCVVHRGEASAAIFRNGLAFALALQLLTGPA